MLILPRFHLVNSDWSNDIWVVGLWFHQSAAVGVVMLM